MKAQSLVLKTIAVLYLLTTVPMLYANKTTITYCIDPNWLPYEAIENNKHIGLSSDYIKLLSEMTPYQFELVKTQSWQQSLNFTKSGQCMLLPMLNQTTDRNQFLDFTSPYFSAPNFLVSTQEQPFLQSLENIGARTLGVTQGYRITEFIQNNYPKINTVTFATEDEGLNAVAEGQVDLFIGSVLSINNHIQAKGLTNLKLAGWGGPNDILRMGFAKGHEALVQEIDQVLGKITQQQHFDIYNRWNDVTVIDNTNYSLIWQVVLGGLILLVLLLLRYSFIRQYNQKLTAKNEQLNTLQKKLIDSNAVLQRVSQHDALTDLYNRHYFNQLIAGDKYQNLNNGPLCLIFLDLDYFKNINDSFGHVMGDLVLKSFGQLLKSCCTKGEVIGRWGGEEFVILQQPALVSDAEKLCMKIQHAMANHIFPHQEPLTCSFGVAQMHANESLMSCFSRADQMLYQAKNEGRNRIYSANLTG